jgi:hypothetical protein
MAGGATRPRPRGPGGYSLMRSNPDGASLGPPAGPSSHHTPASGAGTAGGAAFAGANEIPIITAIVPTSERPTSRRDAGR